jgi:hypothetical protein
MREMRNEYRILVRKTQERTYMGQVSVDGTILLKRMKTEIRSERGFGPVRGYFEEGKKVIKLGVPQKVENFLST